MKKPQLRERILEVYQRGYLMSLGTQDAGGVWVSDVIYIWDQELNLYWMSDPDARHSRAIRESGAGAATITVSVPYTPDLGVQIAGTARELRGRRYDLAVKHFAKRKKAKPSKLPDVLQGDKWYQLTPTRIECIDEEYCGFEKRALVVSRPSFREVLDEKSHTNRT